MLMQQYMQDGMEVTFLEVVGMEELNDGRPRKVKNCKVGCGFVWRCPGLTGLTCPSKS